MDYILRPNYLEAIERFRDQDVIKVLVGLRRAGKSTLLHMLRDRLKREIPDVRILEINFESGQFLEIRDAAALIRYVHERVIDPTEKVYLLFDEIQRVKHFEEAINAFRVDLNCDIYITGSNASLLSGDLATLLAGRYVTFEISPFSFAEVASSAPDRDRRELFRDFVRFGGMPFIREYRLKEPEIQKYLSDLYASIVLKDVMLYNEVRDVDFFQRLTRYVLEHVGCTFSARSLQKYFKSEGRQKSVDTIMNYLAYLEAAFFIRRAPRYDVVGKRTLAVDEKYFVMDQGFREAVVGNNVSVIERILENIVFNELVARGYTVNIGRINDLEIDFIATRSDETAYFQVAYLMGDPATRSREFAPLLKVRDNFPKFVLSLDEFDFNQSGVRHLNLLDFLLSDRPAKIPL